MILKFSKKVNEKFPEVPVDVRLEMWDKLTLIEDLDSKVEVTPEEADIKVNNTTKTCKHIFNKGKNENMKCTTKARKGEYCCKHKRV